MADDPGRIDLEALYLLLPRLRPEVSRGAHLDAPRLHAQDFINLWAIDTRPIVPLAVGFRLLDKPAVARAILYAAANEERARLRAVGPVTYASRLGSWSLPSPEPLLPELRDALWEAMLKGVLVTEGISGTRGQRYRVVRPAELLRLQPDWPLSRLLLNGSDKLRDVRLHRLPAEPVKQTWRTPATDVELETAAKKVAQAYAPEARPSFEEFWGKLKEILPGATRKEARKALDYVPQLRGRRGYRSTRPPS